MKVELISWTKDPIKTIAKAASTCYLSEPSIKIVKSCIKSGHDSILEFASFVFRISGIDRATANQLVRHRMASYAQTSQRYTLPKEQFIYPEEMNSTKYKQYNSAFKAASEAYDNLIEMGTKKEDARAVLPNACQTTIMVCMNLRSLSHFMGLRLCSKAQRPIRTMAKEMKKAIINKQNEIGLTNEELSVITSLLVPKCELNEIKFCSERKSCGRHRTEKEINEILNKI